MPGVCARCHREVYFAEERLALDKVWHTFCFSCLNCRKLLDSCTVSTHRGELFCRNCYSRLFPTILSSSRNSHVSKEIKTFRRATFPPTKTSVSESDCFRCCSCCVEDNPIGEASSIDGKDYRSENNRLRGGGEKKENLESSTEGIDENPINVPSTPRPCPRLSVRRVSFRKERDTIERYRDTRNDREAFSADRETTSRGIVNSSDADILTIRSTEDVRRSNEDLNDEESMNYSQSVSLAHASRHASRHDSTIVSEHNEDYLAKEDMSNCNNKSLEDSRNHIEDEENADEDDDRMRGGHGGNGSCGSRKREGCCASKLNQVNQEYGCSSCQNSEDRCCGYRKRFFGSSETCPPSREFDPCQDDRKSVPCKTAACSPACADRRGTCLPAGCREVCRKARRSCCSPCKGESPGCGGGGCCGSGCRGGCGKLGQICMPARACSTPPCRPHPPYGSPCVPPRACPPSPVRCRPASRGGCCVGGGGPSYCRSASPPSCTGHSGGCCFDLDRTCRDIDGADSSCKSKVPPGCECLGGGLDCQRCGRKVYQAEMQIVSGAPYHNICFSCFCCRKPLEPLTYQENCGEIYCKQCYIRNFGPQGYGYGVGAGALQTPL